MKYMYVHELALTLICIQSWVCMHAYACACMHAHGFVHYARAKSRYHTVIQTETFAQYSRLFHCVCYILPIYVISVSVILPIYAWDIGEYVHMHVSYACTCAYARICCYILPICVINVSATLLIMALKTWSMSMDVHIHVLMHVFVQGKYVSVCPFTTWVM